MKKKTTTSKQSDTDNEKLAESFVDNPQVDQLSASDSANDAKHEPALKSEAEIDTHLTDFAGVVAAGIQPSLPNPKVAAIYAAVRPVLQIVQGLLFFKPKWSTAIKSLIAVMDLEFPTALNY